MKTKNYDFQIRIPIALIKLLIMVMLTACLAIAANAQVEDTVYYEPLKLAGPRAGLTYIGGDLGRQMKEYNIGQYVSLVGWQFETRYFQTNQGFQGLIETVVLLGGFETEKPFLSGSLLMGFRTRDGFEAGIGPNINTTGARSLVLAVGHTAKIDGVYIPVNFALIPSSNSVKYTFMIGFVLHRK